MEKGFMSVKRPPCHPEHEHRHAELVSASDKRKVLVSVETSSTHFFLFGSNAARKKKETGGAQRKNKRRLLAAWQICFANLFAPFACALTRNGGVKSDTAAGVKAFTLAEVLITLAIIGVVAALTIPAVVKNYQETQFKTAYKKAFSDMNRAFSEAIAFSEFPERKNDCYDVNFANFIRDTMKEKFKVIKDCPKGHAFECWVEADTVDSSKVPRGEASAFVDASGRVWAEFQVSRSIILVDTNGSKAPNRFGKDRWQFAFFNKGGSDDCTITPSIPVHIRPYSFNDYLTENSWCNFPPCYYKSWLMK